MLASVATLGSAGFVGGAATRGSFSDVGTDSGSWTAGKWVSKELVVYFTGEITTARHETGTTTYGVTDAGGLGPVTSAFDATYSIPFTDSNAELKLVDDGGSVQTLSTGTVAPKTGKSILASGSWDGSDSSVFFATGSEIHRVAPSDADSTLIAAPSNGAEAVLGSIDIDGDGTDELLFVDSSTTARYLNPEETNGTEVGSVGSDTQYGIGAPIATDAGPRVPFVTENNDVALHDDDTTTEATTVTSGGTAQKTAVAGHDVDGDGANEVTFVDTDGRLLYADDLTQETTPKEFHDGAGTSITDADPSVGVL